MWAITAKGKLQVRPSKPENGTQARKQQQAEMGSSKLTTAAACMLHALRSLYPFAAWLQLASSRSTDRVTPSHPMMARDIKEMIDLDLTGLLS